MGMELEWKYAATGDALDAIAAAQPGPWQETAMETRYFDTADGALSARRWTLRLRLEGGRPVVCLKTPAPGGARGEWEWPGSSLPDAVPALIAAGAPAELAALTAGSHLQEVCAAAFLRRAATVELAGSIAELALDQGVLRGGGREAPLCEMEVEHKHGDAAVSAAFAAALAAAHRLQPEPRSKFARALALAKG